MAIIAAVDSNALTYLVAAIGPRYDRTHDDPSLAGQRLAMMQSFVYRI